MGIEKKFRQSDEIYVIPGSFELYHSGQIQITQGVYTGIYFPSPLCWVQESNLSSLGE